MMFISGFFFHRTIRSHTNDIKAYAQELADLRGPVYYMLTTHEQFNNTVSFLSLVTEKAKEGCYDEAKAYARMIADELEELHTLVTESKDDEGYARYNVHSAEIDLEKQQIAHIIYKRALNKVQSLIELLSEDPRH